MRDVPLEFIDAVLSQLDTYTTMNAFLDAGTLLGIVRNGKLIPHDTDIDIAVLVQPGVEPDNLEISGSVVRETWRGGDLMQRAFDTQHCIVDFTFFRFEEGDWRTHTEHGILMAPDHKITPIGRRHGFPVPALPESYLAFRFGVDWGAPRSSKGAWERDANNLVRYA